MHEACHSSYSMRTRISAMKPSDYLLSPLGSQKGSSDPCSPGIPKNNLRACFIICFCSVSFSKQLKRLAQLISWILLLVCCCWRLFFDHLGFLLLFRCVLFLNCSFLTVQRFRFLGKNLYVASHYAV